MRNRLVFLLCSLSVTGFGGLDLISSLLYSLVPFAASGPALTPSLPARAMQDMRYVVTKTDAGAEIWANNLRLFARLDPADRSQVFLTVAGGQVALRIPLSALAPPGGGEYLVFEGRDGTMCTVPRNISKAALAFIAGLPAPQTLDKGLGFFRGEPSSPGRGNNTPKEEGTGVCFPPDGPPSQATVTPGPAR